MKVFAFCLYGKYQDKYYLGMKKNVEIIHQHFPDFHIYAYTNETTDQKAINSLKEQKQVKIIPTDSQNSQTMCYRFLGPMCDPEVEIFFTRDSDSRINERDRWCISQFLEQKDKFLAHTVRDHFWHKKRFTGGISGFNMVNLRKYWTENNFSIQKVLSTMIKQQNWTYGDDEKFAEKHLHPHIPREKVLVHTDICPFENEQWFPIKVARTDDFIGNVVLFEEGKEKLQFRYWDFDWLKHLQWLRQQNQFGLALDLFESKIDQFIEKEPENRVRQFLNGMFGCYHFEDDIQGCQKILARFNYCFINENTKRNGKFLISLMKRKNWKIIGSTDLSYQPQEKELVVYFGNFPDDYNCLPHSNKMYVNAVYFDKFKFHRFVYDSVWESVDRIYIMGLISRQDRKAETLAELARMGAPLDRVFYYGAQKNPNITGYAGATENHMNCIKDMVESKHQLCLFLEDDFVFCSDLNQNKKSLKTFFERKYDYHMTFLSVSKMHKRVSYDDLMIKSQQECTTCSGYFLQSSTAKDILANVTEAYQNLLQNKNPNVYCVDRWWYKMMNEHNFLIFKNKLGYQRPSYSNLKNEVVMFLD